MPTTEGFFTKESASNVDLLISQAPEEPKKDEYFEIVLTRPKAGGLFTTDETFRVKFAENKKVTQLARPDHKIVWLVTSEGHQLQLIFGAVGTAPGTVLAMLQRKG